MKRTTDLYNGATSNRSAARRTARCVGIPIVAFAILTANGCWPLLRFDSTIANWLLETLSLCLPFALIYTACIPRRILSRALVLLTMSPIVFAFAFFAFLNLMMGPDLRTTCFRADGYVLRSYTSRGCGFFCDPSVTVQQERLFLPGVLLVRQLADFEQADSATCTRSGSDTFVLQVSDANLDPEDVPQREIVRLKPYLYF